MPFRCRKQNNPDVEYFEPQVTTPFDTMDIADFILHRLHEPERSICHAVVLQGENIGHVAAVHHLSRKRIGQILRTSLLPLAEDFDIVRTK